MVIRKVKITIRTFISRFRSAWSFHWWADIRLRLLSSEQKDLLRRVEAMNELTMSQNARMNSLVDQLERINEELTIISRDVLGWTPDDVDSAPDEYEHVHDAIPF